MSVLKKAFALLLVTVVCWISILSSQYYYSSLSSETSLSPEVDTVNLQPTKSSKNLSPKLINGVKKFVFFVGYARSGHSIIGSLMDAHPHVVISNEFFLFTKFNVLNKATDSTWKDNLFKSLYTRSLNVASTKLQKAVKGYTLAVDDLWQGKFEDHIEVIGDKSGGMTTIAYQQDKNKFRTNYKILKEKVTVPLRIIHAVRNPFDIISTKLLTAKIHFKVFSNSVNTTSTADRWSSHTNGKLNNL